MTALSIGDLAHSLVLQRQNAVLKSRLTGLTQEMASGRAVDTSKHLNGSFAELNDIEARSTQLKGYRTAASEAATMASVMQAALTRFNDSAGALSRNLMAVSGSTLTQVTSAASRAAVDTFSDMVQALNTQAAGRSLFGGILTGTAPVAAPTQMLSDLRGALSGVTDLATIQATIADYFLAPAGGFATTAYLGSPTSRAPVAIADGVAVGFDIRADDTAVRTSLAQAATAALAGDPALGWSQDVVNALLATAAEGLVASQTGVTALQADLGFAEARIEQAQTRAAAEQAALDTARNTLLAIDPYATASALEEVRFQLESLYAMTARLSRLSLTDYLR